MTLQIDLNETLEELLTKAAAEKHLDLDAYISELVKKEATRLWHIERCKPKEKRPKFRIIPEAREMLEIYTKLQTEYGDAFAARFGAQLEALQTAIETSDDVTVLEMHRKQPWARRWDHHLQPSAVDRAVSREEAAPEPR